MPSARKKDISLAKSLGELNQLAQIKEKILKNANIKTWINSAEKVYRKAVDYDLIGDEENAYVFYMRFFNIVQEVTKTTKYQVDKKYYSSLISKSMLGKAISQAEKLSESLTARYKKLEQETKAAAIEKEKLAKEKERNEKTKNQNGTASNTLQDIDDLLNGKKISSQTSSDVYKKLQVNHSTILSPSDTSSDKKDAFSTAPVKSILSSAIDPVALYNLLKTDMNDVLVLDTRNKKDFESSRINYSCCINIPNDLLKTSVMVGSIERKLPESTWHQWIERGKKGHIVILDQSSKYKDIKPDSKVQCLKDAIYLYDTSCSLRSEPVILDGGYEAWLWHFPSLVTNPVLPQILPSQVNTDFNLDALSYPELPTLPKQPTPSPSNGPANGQANPPPEVPDRISQNIPSAVKGSNPKTLPNNESAPRPVPQNNNTQQPSQGTTPQRQKPSIPTSNIVPNGVTHHRVHSPQGVHSPQQVNSSSQFSQPELPSAIVSPSNKRQANQATPTAQSNQPRLPQNSGQTAPINNHSHTVPSQNVTSLHQPQNDPHPIVPPSLNIATSMNSPTGVPSVAPTPPINQVPTTLPAQVNHIVPSRPQQQPVMNHPSDIVAPQSLIIANGQPPPTPQGLPSAQMPSNHVNPQSSMAQELRPNVSGILPKMQARNPTPNIPTIATSVPQSGTHVPQSGTHVPQSGTYIPQPSTQVPQVGSHVPPVSTPRVPQSPAKPMTNVPVPQTFTSSRTGMTHGLPPGWERVLDRKTGRYYFQDHNTKTTHWNLPESLTQSMNKSIMGGNTPTVKEAEAKKPSLKRSLSSPNLAKIESEEPKASLPKSPANRPSVNRRTKPLTESQLANLSPSHGGQGKALTGLRNLGNSCYMNSVLQCLIATAPLAKYILDSSYLDDINKTNPLGTGGRIAEELAVLTRVAHSGNYKYVSPVEFKRTIGRFAPEFGGSKQQDSQEFLLVLLDQFHEDTNRVIKKAYIEEKGNDGLPDSMAARLAWENHKKRNQSIIVELLQGQFKSTLTCSVCNKRSVTFDAFMSLTLPIPTNASCQIEDCIKLFTTREKVSKDNKWFCPKCKQHREAWKTMEIWKLPPVLIIHFNRFKRDFDGSWLEKRQTNVHFPSTNLNLSRFVLGPNKSLRYNLYGVSNHYGCMQSGHYTAFCKNIYDGRWHKFDDSDVSTMSESSVKSSAAYILCYTSMEFTKP